MSEEEKAVVAQGTETPAVVAAIDPTKSESTEPHWLKARLEREEAAATKKILNALGVDSLSKAQESLAALKNMQVEKLSEEERLRAKSAELEGLVKKTSERVGELESLIKVQSETELVGLSETQKQTVLTMADNDPAKIVSVIKSLKAAGFINSKTNQAPVPAAASTVPGSSAPAPTMSVNDNVVAKYQELQKTSPYEASQFYLANVNEIINAKRTR